MLRQPFLLFCFCYVRSSSYLFSPPHSTHFRHNSFSSALPAFRLLLIHASIPSLLIIRHYGHERLGISHGRPGRPLGCLTPSCMPYLSCAASWESGYRGGFRYAWM